ncbi:hypothetical protein, partial [Klebsiella aerogenes]|uniref:hypothetical protein n=1 Tax=Klebsiella aerogenes TaxID=548 RepID=UPI003D16A2D9
RRAEQELEDIQQVIDEEGGDFQAAAWDWLYYGEQVRPADAPNRSLKTSSRLLMKRAVIFRPRPGTGYITAS